MPTPAPDRPALLVVQAAAEPFVLAKLVQALRPQRILLFASTYARAKGWDLALCERYRNEKLIDGFDIAELPDLAGSARADGEYGTIESAVRRAVGATSAATTIVVDTTRGLGLARIQIYEAVRRVATGEHRLSIAYCDADRGQVLLSSVFPAAPVEAIEVRFGLDARALDRRLAIYGVYATMGAENPIARDVALAVFDAMCSSSAVRALFHSGQSLRVTWKILHRARGLAPDTLGRLLDYIARRATDGLSYDLGPERVDPGATSRTVREHLAACTDGATDNLFWCKTYLSNRAPSYWTQALRGLEDALRLAIRIPAHLSSNDRAEAARARDAALLRMRKFVVGFLIDELSALFAEPDDGPQMPRDHYRQFIADHLARVDVPAIVRKDLENSMGRLPALFEQCLSAAVARSVSQCNAEAHVQVYENVKVLRSAPAGTVAEFDTVLLHASGDILVLEAKTHFSSATHKDIESRIKQLRDLGGAYNQFYLVFPLVRADLDALAAGRTPTTTSGTGTDLAEADTWLEFMRRVGASRDQRILGIDEIPAAVARDLARLNRQSGKLTQPSPAEPAPP